ncbi:MAG: NAD-dependent epimerase/dehydratase family protein [Thermoanaerobaculia bacterium]
MSGNKHILLGAGGPISNALARELVSEGEHPRLVSRSGSSIEGAESARADLLDSSVLQAVDAGAIVYLLAGLPYNTTIWRDQWPRIMRNTIDACATRGARLIFFDNVYMYGRVDGVMTEETPVAPSSRKGEIRARIAGDLLAAASSGRVKACIARSADFYGPGAVHGIPHQLVFTRLQAGKPAQWLVNANVPHSLTYTEDCGRALALLAKADDAWGQVWHLPTASPPLTGTEFIAMTARAMKTEPRLKILRPWMMRVAGLFNRTIGEVVETLYQYEGPYVFDSSKFNRRFSFSPTPYERGVEETARHLATRSV